MSIGPIILYVIVFLLLFIAWAILLKELTKPKHLRNQYQTLVANIMYGACRYDYFINQQLNTTLY